MKKEYLDSLKKSNMFNNLSEKEILMVLDCLKSEIKSYEKDEAIYLQQSSIKDIAIVLKGILQIKNEDIEGNVFMINEINIGEMFAEAYICANISKIPVSIWSKTKSSVLFINYSKLLKICSNACSFHNILIKNMLEVLALKLIETNSKLRIIQNKSIREKLIAYFEICSQKNKSKIFELAFNKTVLSEYLGVNRSAMSRELKNMQKDEIIKINGKYIELL